MSLAVSQHSGVHNYQRLCHWQFHSILGYIIIKFKGCVFMSVSNCSGVHIKGRKVACPWLFHNVVGYISKKGCVSLAVSQCSGVHIKGRKVACPWLFHNVVGCIPKVERLCVPGCFTV